MRQLSRELFDFDLNPIMSGFRIEDLGSRAARTRATLKTEP